MKRVGIIGAGAVGAYFIWGMTDCEGVELFLLAEGERSVRLKQGIRINGELWKPEVKTPEEVADVDVILVCTKYHGLSSAIDLLKKVSDEGTIILSLLNGVDSEEKIKAAGVPGTVLTSVMRIASRRTDEGITFRPDMTEGVFFGAVTQEEEGAVRSLQQLFDQTKIKCTIMGDIVRDMWLKYAANLANNLPQAVLGTDASLYTDSEHGMFIASAIWKEAWKVAEAKGISLPEKPLIFLSVPKTSKYSTLQDLEAGRHTEVDMLAGQLIQMAKELGMEVPYTEYTWHAIKALEEKNDGLIGC